MDSFPDHINRETCMKTLEKNQYALILLTREKFTNAIEHALANSDKTIVLTFDDKLWPEHRKTITMELLDRFGEFACTTANGSYSTTKTTSNEEEIPSNIKMIKITL